MFQMVRGKVLLEERGKGVDQCQIFHGPLLGLLEFSQLQSLKSDGLAWAYRSLLFCSNIEWISLFLSFKVGWGPASSTSVGLGYPAELQGSRKWSMRMRKETTRSLWGSPVFKVSVNGAVSDANGATLYTFFIILLWQNQASWILFWEICSYSEIYGADLFLFEVISL